MFALLYFLELIFSSSNIVFLYFSKLLFHMHLKYVSVLHFPCDFEDRNTQEFLHFLTWCLNTKTILALFCFI